MDTLRRLLPSANNLIVFEAAGRLLSFTAASRELGMTQAAVSLAVKRLERHLGTSLFQREHRRVVLTETGGRFYAEVSRGLHGIFNAAERIRIEASGAHVTLSASTAFASFWMLPRLQKFREDMPGIDLRIQTADRDLDLVAEGIPLGIRGGDQSDWPDYELTPLSPEEIYAVCGASYRDRFGMPQNVEDLAGHRLIHLDEPHRPAATWSEWFQSAGLDGKLAPRGLQINDYVLVIQSVLEGQGIALGWSHLTEQLVAKGLLVRVTDHVMKTGKAFHVAIPRNRELNAAARAVHRWLVAQGSAPSA